MNAPTNPAAPGDALAKVAMLQNSLRCLIFGLLGLLPILGLPFAVASLVLAGKVRQAERHHWNPARAYCLWGGAAAALGTIFWFIIGVLIAASIISNSR